MKVINKQTHYSVIFMRDDAEVTILRMKKTSLKLLIWLLAFWVLIGCGGIAVGILIGKSYYQLSKKYKDMERQVVDGKLQLERLSSLQAFLQASGNGAIAASRVKNEEIVSGTADNDVNGAIAANAQRNATGALPREANAATAVDVTGAVTLPGKANRNATEASPPAEELPLISSDGSPVRVENFNVWVDGQLRLKVRYDIISAQELNQQLTGRVSYSVILDNSKRIEVKAQNYGETRFAIMRMKQMENTLQIPAGINVNALMVKGVEITVDIGDGTRQFREVYPLTES